MRRRFARKVPSAVWSPSLISASTVRRRPAAPAASSLGKFINRLSNIKDIQFRGWSALLEGAFPPHLRYHRKPLPTPHPRRRRLATLGQPRPLGASDVARILLTAQYPPRSGRKGIDVLFHLAFTHNRWPAVLWLIKKLVDHFPPCHSPSTKLEQVQSAFAAQSTDLSCLLDNPIELDAVDASPSSLRTEASSLECLSKTEPLRLNKWSPRHRFAHDAIGQIWRSLGSMTKACVGGDIRPEVLEIIAYLHHREMMPLSIYQLEPHSDTSAIQRPPLLPFLSSRILTSLSDAAWRAHEKLVLEEAKAEGSQNAYLRPEIPGTVFRVHVAGLRPEVWMELILWSCLYGGWTKQGAQILRSLTQEEKPRWKLLSWKKYEEELPPNFRTEPRDWRSWECVLKSRPASNPDEAEVPKRSVERTISSEVVNAYIDAIASGVATGVGSRGLLIEDVAETLHDLQTFMSSWRQGLSFGTWDALVLRLLENQSCDGRVHGGNLKRLVGLSQGFGQGLYDENTQELPTYIFDGSTAMQGLLHRELQGQISHGSFEGVLEIFGNLQAHQDMDKSRSVSAFFGGYPSNLGDARAGSSLFNTLGRQGMFTSNLDGIEYPSFDAQIPTTILGPFLDRITDAKEFEFGSWLCTGNTMEGPIIQESMYEDPYIQSALLRFASEINSKSLLTKMLQHCEFSGDMLRSILDSHITRLQWDSATAVLDTLGKYQRWAAYNLANLVRTMLVLKNRAESTTDVASRLNLQRAEQIFTAMVRLEYEGGGAVNRPRIHCIQSVLTVLSAVGHSWATLCRTLHLLSGNYYLQMKARDFNLILEGALTAYGSHVGRLLLDTFWPPAARFAYDAPLTFLSGRPGNMHSRMPRFRPTTLQSVRRIKIELPLPREEKGPVVYGTFAPNVETILSIIYKALEEISTSRKAAAEEGEESFSGESGRRPPAPTKEQTSLSTARETVEWGVRILVHFPYLEERTFDHLHKSLEEVDLGYLRSILPASGRFACENSRRNKGFLGTFFGNRDTDFQILQEEL